MYQKVSTKLDFAEREKNVIEFWKENNVFEESINNRENAPVFTFYDGPPTANGKPHIGHVLTRAIKDIIPRYKTMKGYKVLRKAGWDTHGLPVELEVEKILGIEGKDQIENYGIEKFITQCKESVWKYEAEWRNMSERVGFWADMENPYVTYHNSYIESIWWALKQIWDKDLIYKGHKIVPYCPRCETSLSSHEVAQGYKDVKEKSIYVKFKIKGEDNKYLLAWTTTPWTLPSNVALIINEKETYVEASLNGDTYVMAEALVPAVLGEDAVIDKKFIGKDLVGTEYEPLFDYAKVDKKAHYVVSDSYVTLTDGTGIVHSAPAFGEDDARVARIFDLPFVQLVDGQGKFKEEAYDLAGVFVKDADPMIIEKLDNSGLLFKVEEYEHSYPFCWRCDTPLLYYARNTWFIEMTKVRDNLIKNNNTVNWIPENIKQGRFGNFLENVVDWGLSRERYWGTPLPIWECECGHRDMIGSIAELKEKGENIPDDIELHRPYIDNVTVKCTKCGGTMKRVEEVIDCWFDSGAMPFAQHHYPFENKEIFDENYPADFISEAIDQTRGWFYTLMAISTLLFDKAPYKNVIVMGHVQDKDGQKMSKHKGNVVDTWSVLNKQGADAVRWYFYTASSPWLPSRFYEEAINEGQRKFMGTLWNTYAFYVLYAELDNFNPYNYEYDNSNENVMDKWIISKYNSLIKTVDKGLEEYKITESARAIQEFTDELSNWYVRRCRERFWQSGMEQDKINAYKTLNDVLVGLVKLSAPFVPFIAESIYSNLVCNMNDSEPKSVHLSDFPVADEKKIDKELEASMDDITKIIIKGRSCRNTSNVKNRQPLGKMYVKSDMKLDDDYIDIVLQELNVKKLEYIDDMSAFVDYSFKPQLKTLGPKFGKDVPKIAEALKTVDGVSSMAKLEAGDSINLNIDGNEISLFLEDVLSEKGEKEGYVTEADNNMTVTLDINLTEELIEEGYVRELVSKIQNMRKEAGFEVQDHIVLGHSGNDKLGDVISKNADEISSDVLADSIKTSANTGYTKEWDINGENITLSVEKV